MQKTDSSGRSLAWIEQQRQRGTEIVALPQLYYGLDADYRWLDAYRRPLTCCHDRQRRGAGSARGARKGASTQAMTQLTLALALVACGCSWPSRTTLRLALAAAPGCSSRVLQRLLASVACMLATGSFT
jgi:hypothetical protein